MSHGVFLNANIICKTEMGPARVHLLIAGKDRGGRGKLSLLQRRWCEVLLEWAGVERRKYLDPHWEPEQHQITNKHWAIWVTARITEVLGVKNKFYCNMIGKMRKAERVRWNGEIERRGLSEVWFLSRCHDKMTQWCAPALLSFPPRRGT